MKVALYMRLARPWYVAFYSRVACADADALFAQESMLINYAESNGYESGEFNTHRFYSDNGESGLTLGRPGMDKLMADARDGRIDVLIVKDLSRVARNFMLIDDWLRFLKKYGVRFISVNDEFSIM